MDCAAEIVVLENTVVSWQSGSPRGKSVMLVTCKNIIPQSKIIIPWSPNATLNGINNNINNNRTFSHLFNSNSKIRERESYDTGWITSLLLHRRRQSRSADFLWFSPSDQDNDRITGGKERAIADPKLSGLPGSRLPRNYCISRKIDHSGYEVESVYGVPSPEHRDRVFEFCSCNVLRPLYTA